MSAREDVLARIRRALHEANPAELPTATAYRSRSQRDDAEVVEEFREKVRDYGVQASLVKPAELKEAIGSACLARGARRLAVPADLPRQWLPQNFEWLSDGEPNRLSPAELDAVDGVLTGCSLAIAQTGTIVLDGGPRQGRRMLSLLPDYHLCVVEAGQLVDLVPEAIARMEDSNATRRALTLISGPSATSDIELSRVEGVHGPRTLQVLLLEG